MKVLIYSNKNKDKDFLKTKEIINYLISKEVEVVVSEEMSVDFEDLNISIFNKEETEQIKFILVLGGDGTFLAAAHKYYEYHIPYLGLNLGRVGYLTECNMNDCYQIIDKVLDNRYKINPKSLLEVKIVSEQGYEKMVAFNEVLIHRGHYIKMVKIDMKIKDQFMDSFYADGVLVSTSMGSSAYNLSAGGPLLLENVNCFVITAICSQSGIMPSVVFDAEDQVEITSYTKDEQKYLVVVDGKDQIEVPSGTKVFVRKASEVLQVISTEIENKKINHITKAFNGYIK